VNVFDVHDMNVLRKVMSRSSINTGVATVAPLEGSARENIDGRRMADLLLHVEREANVSQRKLARELGVAVGLVNAYLKRCVKKGLIKVEQVPSRRYAYFLTPSGFAEKSRLTAEYLYWSLSFFRRARAECAELMEFAKQRGWATVVLSGGSDLTEIALLCAIEHGIEVIAVVDPDILKSEIMGIPVVASLAAITRMPDGWIITGIHNAALLYDALLMHAGPDHVLTPALLNIRPSIAAGNAR
jgi:DNA-binding MarR family transcriptional regulator